MTTMTTTRCREARRVAVLASVVGLGWVGCAGSDVDPEPPLAGGATTVFDRSSNAYAFPAPNLTPSDLELHLEGDVAFEAVFVSPPATIHPGLGPLFNNNACVRCHIRDGRGLPVAGQGPLGSALLVRVSGTEGAPIVPGGAVPAGLLGTQLQDHATYGRTPEATITLDWIEEPGEYGDGEPFSLRRPRLTITLANGEPLPADVLTSPRIPPPVFGLGLLEAVPEAAILALADPEDRDDDGISGRANYVWDVERGAEALGRFGWKASVPTLRQQAATAYAEDMGVSSPMFPELDGRSEIDAHTLDVVAFYTRTLAVPARDALESVEVRRGEELFREVGCASCHVEGLRTGDDDVSAISNQTIRPYTDLLLHNVGFELADGFPDSLASGTEWRTAPLWGLGLTQTVLPYSAFLHDGRARTLEEAILWHGGEAERAKEEFRMSPKRDRDALVAFLRSL